MMNIAVKITTVINRRMSLFLARALEPNTLRCAYPEIAAGLVSALYILGA